MVVTFRTFATLLVWVIVSNQMALSYGLMLKTIDEAGTVGLPASINHSMSGEDSFKVGHSMLRRSQDEKDEKGSGGWSWTTISDSFLRNLSSNQIPFFKCILKPIKNFLDKQVRLRDEDAANELILRNKKIANDKVGAAKLQITQVEENLTHYQTSYGSAGPNDKLSIRNTLKNDERCTRETLRQVNTIDSSHIDSETLNVRQRLKDKLPRLKIAIESIERQDPDLDERRGEYLDGLGGALDGARTYDGLNI